MKLLAFYVKKNMRYYFSKYALFIIFSCVMLISSCASYDQIPYFRDLNQSKITTEPVENYSPHVIQPLDELLIHVGSLNPDASAVFNNNLQVTTNNPNIPVYDYLVDKNGEISLSSIGTLKVAGLTTDELSIILKDKLTTFLKEPKVSVRLINFKFAVLGDVARPGVYNSYSERLTVTQALSYAGDLNITALRTNIILVRETNGKRTFYPVDLTSKNLFKSPYFYLKSNDEIFVQPSKLKLTSIENPAYRNASLIISALSVVVTLAYLVYHK